MLHTPASQHATLSGLRREGRSRPSCGNGAQDITPAHRFLSSVTADFRTVDSASGDDPFTSSSYTGPEARTPLFDRQGMGSAVDAFWPSLKIGIGVPKHLL
jgi:hypothetical protein